MRFIGGFIMFFTWWCMSQRYVTFDLLVEFLFGLVLFFAGELFGALRIIHRNFKT